VQQGPGDNPQLRIVGVVERLITPFANNDARGEYSIILPIRYSGGSTRYAVRTAPGQRDAVMGRVQDALRAVAGEPISIRTRSLDEDRTIRYRDDKAMAWMLVAVSGLLLLVTVSGVVGMTTLRVAQRRKQIGVRRALGARRVDILRYFMTENTLVTGVGIVAGCLLAMALSQLLASRLEMSKLPFAYLLGGAAIFFVLGSASVLGPLVRAGRISPALATRSA
jgi:putative ABC transport system permease protein